MAAPETNLYGHQYNASEATLTSSPLNSTFQRGSSSNDGGDPPFIPHSPVVPNPPARVGRTLVLCFDGTGDQFDGDNSNIVELFAMLKKEDNEQQMCYYQAGIGTYTNPLIVTPLMSKISKTLDEAFAWNLHTHVTDGYEFLMQNYKAGDRISIFGFSRGAYTARALAGMLHKVGLLPACNHQQIPFAYKMFTGDDNPESWEQSRMFKKTFSVEVKIDFIGVWDTVSSVGLIPRSLPFTKRNTIVRTFRHAIALDERRSKFKANVWDQPPDKILKEADFIAAQAENAETVKKTPKTPRDPKKAKRKTNERSYSAQSDTKPDVKEVWFAGCHCDIGGGSVANGTAHTLARIPLRWMIRECFATNTGIMFHTEGLRALGIEPINLYPIFKPPKARLPAGDALIQRIPKPIPPKPATADANEAVTEVVYMSEEEHERLDALSPIYDQLSLAWFWWILEYLPMKQMHQNEEGVWAKQRCLNRGQGRRIPKQKKGTVFIHRSVKTRMEAEHHEGDKEGKETKYESRASFQKAIGNKKVVWVDE